MEENLKRILDTIRRLQIICESVVEEAYHANNMEIKLPINIEMVAEYLEIDLKSEYLNYIPVSGLNRDIAQLQYNNYNEEKIDIDREFQFRKSSPYNDLEIFAIANEIGKYILKSSEYNKTIIEQEGSVRKINFYSIPYQLPFLYLDIDKFLYEMCSIFLMLPMDKFLDEYANYMDRYKNYLSYFDEWIKDLAIKIHVPYYVLLNGYKWIEFCAFSYYKEKEKGDKEEFNNFVKKYGHLFCEI